MGKERLEDKPSSISRDFDDLPFRKKLLSLFYTGPIEIQAPGGMMHFPEPGSEYERQLEELAARSPEEDEE